MGAGRCRPRPRPRHRHRGCRGQRVGQVDPAARDCRADPADAGVGALQAGVDRFAPERLPARIRMSARTYVAHMAAVRGVGDGAAMDVLDRLGLTPGPDAPVTSLSKGNRQKVVLAQALAAPAGLVLLDEPVGGLDTPAQAALCELVGERRAASASVLVAAHGPVRGLVVDVALVLDAGVLLGRDGDQPRRRIELLRGGRRRVEDLPAAEADAYLAAALAEGWSVVSVRTL